MLDENRDKVETVSASGMPVTERVTSVRAARSLFDDFKLNDEAAARRRARYKGLVDGNPPYDQTELEELGMGDITNVNFLEARSILDQKAAASFELLFEVPTLIEARQAKHLDPQQPAADWGGIVAEEFTKMLFDWSGFVVNVDKARRESDLNDVGLMIWRDEYDWRPRAFSRGSYLPEPGAELDVETHNMFFLRDKFEAGELYRAALKNEELAKEEGWDPEVVKRIMVRVFRDEAQVASDDESQTSRWESLQAKIRSGEWDVQVKETEKVRVVHMLVRETDTGEVSHYIFPEDEILRQTDSAVTEAEDEKFMFRKPRRYQSMSQVQWLLPFNYGDGTLRSVRGMAAAIEPHCDLSNRFLGRVYDAGFMTASLLLQPKTAMDLSRLQLIRMGNLTIIPPGLEAQQSTFQPQISPLVQLRDLSVSIMRNNTGVWKQHPELFAERGPQKTARQVAEEAGREARLEKNSVMFEYDCMQRLYREMYRRATDRKYLTDEQDRPGRAEARRFVARCVQRGVPFEVLMDPESFDIYATQAIGQGSWGVKMDVTNQILSVRGLMDEAGQRNALRDWIAARAGRRNVDRYAPIANRDQITTNESSFAAMENNDMVEGYAVVVGSDQTHAMHLYQHLPAINSIVQAVMENQGEGLDLNKAINLLGRGIPHCGEHLSYLANDPKRKDLVDAVTKALKAGQSVLQFLVKKREALAKMQQQQQAQEQQVVSDAAGVLAGQEAQLKARQQDLDFALDMKKLEQQQVVRQERSRQMSELRRQESAERAALEAEKQAAELEQAARKFEAELEAKRAKTAEGA